MVEKIPFEMVPHIFGVVKNIDKSLLVSTDSQSAYFRYKNLICKELEDLSPNRHYDCIGYIHFTEMDVVKQNFPIQTDYDGKCNAYFCFTFHIFLETPTMNPIICVSWGHLQWSIEDTL